MDSLREWIRKNQVISFYILVFVISWPAMFLAFFVFPRNPAMQGLFGLIATFSPVLIALMISAISKPEKSHERAKTRWLVFVVGWLFSWLILALHTWQIREAPLDLQIIIPTGIVALLPGWLISGNPGNV